MPNRFLNVFNLKEFTWRIIPIHGSDNAANSLRSIDIISDETAFLVPRKKTSTRARCEPIELELTEDGLVKVGGKDILPPDTRWARAEDAISQFYETYLEHMIPDMKILQAHRDFMDTLRPHEELTDPGVEALAANMYELFMGREVKRQPWSEYSLAGKASWRITSSMFVKCLRDGEIPLRGYESDPGAKTFKGAALGFSHFTSPMNSLSHRWLDEDRIYDGDSNPGSRREMESAERFSDFLNNHRTTVPRI